MLGLTQPAMSRTLGQLEKRVGEPLFVKGRRPLQPTALGRALATRFRHARGVAQGIGARRRFPPRTHRRRPGRRSPFFMDGLISGMIAEFQNRAPEIRIEQSYGYLADLRAGIEADRIDLAICPLDILDEGSGMRFEEILPGRNVVACRTTHPLLMRRRVGLAELLDYPWVAPPPEARCLPTCAASCSRSARPRSRSATPAARWRARSTISRRATR